MLFSKTALNDNISIANQFVNAAHHEDRAMQDATHTANTVGGGSGGSNSVDPPVGPGDDEEDDNN